MPLVRKYNIQAKDSWIQAHRDDFRKTKAHLEVTLTRDIKGKKRSFCRYISSKRLNKENVGSLLNGAGDFVTTDTYRAEVYIALFASVFFTNNVSQASVLREEVKGGQELLAANEGWVWDYLSEVNLYVSMRQSASKGAERTGWCPWQRRKVKMNKPVKRDLNLCRCKDSSLFFPLSFWPEA